MLLKTNRGKMLENHLPTMLMKTNKLKAASHDVDEKTASYTF